MGVPGVPTSGLTQPRPSTRLRAVFLGGGEVGAQPACCRLVALRLAPFDTGDTDAVRTPARKSWSVRIVYLP